MIQRNAELGIISEEQKRFCAKCKKWMSEADIESMICDRFGGWTMIDSGLGR